MSHVRRFDHVGITVADLDPAAAFFVALGLEAEGRMSVEGEFLDTVIGMRDARTEIVMLRAPGGGTPLELSSFARPDHLRGSPAAPANELGLRNVCLRGRRPPGGRRPGRRRRLRAGRRHRRVRGRVEDGLRPRARGDHRRRWPSASVDRLSPPQYSPLMTK